VPVQQQQPTEPVQQAHQSMSMPAPVLVPAPVQVPGLVQASQQGGTGAGIPMRAEDDGEKASDDSSDDGEYRAKLDRDLLIEVNDICNLTADPVLMATMNKQRKAVYLSHLARHRTARCLSVLKRIVPGISKRAKQNTVLVTTITYIIQLQKAASS
jgi:hypothetical protein